jgi:hypothetical protein
MIPLPLSSHALEFAVHYIRQTPHLAANIITSMVFTAISTLFNWYAMRRGSWITGRQSQSVVRDLLSMPKLVAHFLAVGPMAIWRSIRPYLWPEAFTGALNESEDAASD